MCNKLTSYGFRRKWLDGRMGHTLYLMFFLTLVNFILISYRFFIEDSSFFSNILSELWIFGIVLISAYIPVSIIIGHWHRKTQLSVEMDIKYKEIPFIAKMFRTWLDGETNKMNMEEIDKIVDRLKEIEKNKK